MDNKVTLHFGYSCGRGHMLDIPGRGGGSINPQRDMPGLPWSIGDMDTGLLTNGNHKDVYDGRVFWTLGGTPLWFAFFWWDRSGDSRGKSNTGLYVRGFRGEEKAEAWAFAQAAWPLVIARQHHPLILRS